MLISLSLFWGSSFIVIKEVIGNIPPLLAFGFRFTISGLALLIVFLIHKPANKENEHIGKQQWKQGLILGVFIVLGGQGLLVWGAQYLASGMTALLNSTIPLWVTLIGAIVLKSRLSRNVITGLITGFVGLIILVNPYSGNANLNPVGVVALTLSSISWAIGSLYSSKSKNNLPISILAYSGILMLLGGLMLLVAGFLIGELTGPQLSKLHFSTNLIISYSYLIFLCTVVGYVEFFWLLRVESASIANSFAYIVHVIAVFLGWLVFRELITFQTIIATYIILIGVALMVSDTKSLSSPKRSR